MTTLYVHIPLCRSKCAYCDFYSVAARGLDPAAIVSALLAELDARTEPGTVFDTLYIGGGTPSALPSRELRRLLQGLTPHVRPGAEVTVEVNPDDVTPALAEMLATEGVNRVSMGIQSLVDSELRAINRRHDAATAIRAFDTLRRAGIGNISCDLIYGLPGQTPYTFSQSIGQLLRLAPEHISAYLLSYEPGTRLTRDLAAGRVRQATDTEAEDYYRLLCRRLHEAGYEHYEISNFALPGKHSRHNSAYWNPAAAYLGLGPSAHSYDGHSIRRANVASVSRYLAAPAEAVDFTEHLTDEEMAEERTMLALRTARGINPTLLTLTRRIKTLQATGHLTTTPEGYLRIPENHWLIADSIIASLI